MFYTSTIQNNLNLLKFLEIIKTLSFIWKIWSKTLQFKKNLKKSIFENFENSKV